MGELDARQHTILLIEDDEDDVFFFRRALAMTNASARIHVTRTAWEARNYVEGSQPFQDRRYYPLPDLIVADMHLRGVTGLEFLKWLRADPVLGHTPIFFHSGNMIPELRERILTGGANGIYLKSADIQKTVENIREMLKALVPSNPEKSGAD